MVRTLIIEFKDKDMIAGYIDELTDKIDEGFVRGDTPDGNWKIIEVDKSA